MRQHLRVLAVAALLVAGPVASASAGTAQDTRLALSADGTTWAEDITTPLLDPGMRWVPGDSQVAGLWFRNQSGTTAEGYAEVTIGPQEEELAADLAVRTRYDDGAWAAGTASPPMTLAGGQMVRLDIEVTFDPLSGNESMDRTVPMSVRVVLADAGAPGAGQEPPGGALPATGVAVWGTIAAALALLVAGAWLVVRGKEGAR